MHYLLLDGLFVVVGTLSSLKFSRRFGVGGNRRSDNKRVSQSAAFVLSIALWSTAFTAMILIELFRGLWLEIFILWFATTVTGIELLRRKRSRIT